jgi:ADP-ribose pyrophosphatase
MSRTKAEPKRTVLKSGKRLRLVRDEGWEYVERVNASGVVAIVAVTDARELLLTEQFRRPVGARVIDLPAGLAGDVEGAASESLATAARRELLEETGFHARRLERLAGGPTSPGLTSEVVTFFRAADLSRIGPGCGVDGEEITTHCIKLGAIDTWLRRRVRCGVQIDVKVYAGLYFASQNKRRSPGGRR